MTESESRAETRVFFRLRERKMSVSVSSTPKCLARARRACFSSTVFSYWWPVKMARGVIMIKATSSERWARSFKLVVGRKRK